MKRFEIHADVLYNHSYLITAESQSEAMNLVKDSLIEPVRVNPVAGPVVVFVKDISKEKL